MARVSRPLFKRNVDYVAVRRIRTGPDSYIEPGEPVTGKTHKMRWWYQRRRIGPAGHPWTEQALESEGLPKAFFVEKTPVDTQTNTDTEPKTELEILQELTPVKIEKDWTVEGYEDRFKTKKEARGFIDFLISEAKNRADVAAAAIEAYNEESELDDDSWLEDEFEEDEVDA